MGINKQHVLKQLRLKAEVVVQEIKRDQYFLDIWNTVSHAKPLSECDRAELLWPFQAFWERLPDDKSIRRGPFFTICDLAEAYCFGDEDDGVDD